MLMRVWLLLVYLIRLGREGGVDQYTKRLHELLRVPLDFCNPSVPITSDLLPCSDKDETEHHILLVCLPASLELNAFTSA